MSKHFPECPLYNHNNCRELHNSKICAVVRKDKVCFRKLQKSRKAHVKFKEAVNRIKDKEPELEVIVEKEGKFNQNRPEKQPEEDKTNGKIRTFGKAKRER